MKATDFDFTKDLKLSPDNIKAFRAAVKELTGQEAPNF